MSWGLVETQALSNGTAEDVFRDIREALNRIGSVQQTDQATLSAYGSITYAFTKVRVKIKVRSLAACGKRGCPPNSVAITIVAFDEGWTPIGARNSIKRLLETKDNLANPNYVPSHKAENLQAGFGWALLFILLVLAVLFDLFNFNSLDFLSLKSITNWLANLNWWTKGFLSFFAILAIRFVICKKAFDREEPNTQ